MPGVVALTLDRLVLTIDSGARMGVKVSVVVPAYNAGRYIDACVDSLLNQTLDSYEVIFVDDGSTDGTGEKLDGVADGSDHVQVVHINNTGGPGGPRNLGAEMASGEYIYFLDSDDWLGPEALERMYAMAMRNGSDIVVGRMVGHGRSVPKWIFRESRDDADILRHHLLALLTPHKLFRAAFVREHGLRFPEGPVRLEDHRFCVPAYFKASKISVLADYPCCHWVKRDDEGNYSANRFDPVHYFAALGEVLDIVDEHVRPGPERDRYYAHWYRGKMLRRLGGGTFLSYPEDYRRELFDEIRELTMERIGTSVERHIPRHMLPRAALLREGAFEDLVRLAEAERGITIRPTVEGLRWDADTLIVKVSADFVYHDGEPVIFRRDGDRIRWELPATLTSAVPKSVLDVTETLGRATLDVLVRHRESGADFFVPTTFSATGDDGDTVTVTLAGEARLHIPTGRQGRPFELGIWDLAARIDVCGWAVERRLGALRSAAAEESCVGGYAGGRLIVPYWTLNGNLSIHVEPESAPHVVAAAATAGHVKASARRIWLTVPVPYVPAEPAMLRLSRGNREFSIAASYAPAPPDAAPYGPAGPLGPHGKLVAVIPRGTGRRRVGTGEWNVDLRGPERSVRLSTVLEITEKGDVRLRTGAGTPVNRAPSLRRAARRIPVLRRIVRLLRGLRIAEPTP